MVRFVRFNQFDNSRAIRKHPFAHIGVFCWCVPEWAFDDFCDHYFENDPVEVIPGAGCKVFHSDYQAADRYVTNEEGDGTPEEFGMTLEEGFVTVGVEDSLDWVSYVNSYECIIQGDVEFTPVTLDDLDESKIDATYSTYIKIRKEEGIGKDEWGFGYPVFEGGRWEEKG